MALVHELLSLHCDVRNTLDARRHGRGSEREEASHDYHPRRGGRYGIGEDQSLSPDLLGPPAFGQHILNAIFPSWYRSLTNILKYSKETNLGPWL